MITIQLRGIEDVKRKLKQFEFKFESKVVREAARDTAKHAHRDVQNNAIYVTGQLHDSVGMEKVRSKRGTHIYRIGLKPSGFYGRFLEFGTKKMAARSWMRPVFDANYASYLREFRERLRSGVDRVAGK